VADASVTWLELGADVLLWHAHTADWAIAGLRILVTVSSIVFIPGFLILRAASPGRRVDLEFVVLSGGTSIATIIVLGLVLHVFNSMTPRGWTVALALVCVGAIVWSGQSKSAEALRPLTFSASRMALASFGIMAVLFAGAIAIARHGAVNQRQFKFTDLWIVPSDGRDLERVTVGVRNHEQHATTYILELVRNGKLLVRWPPFALGDNEERVEVFPISTKQGPEMRIEARLHKADDPLFSRKVWLSNATTETSPCAC
jgi:hypothetical protein